VGCRPGRPLALRADIDALPIRHPRLQSRARRRARRAIGEGSRISAHTKWAR
jgi:hypothetical protein